MSRIFFQEVVVKRVFRWKTSDGKSRQETQKFMQTINPWNKNAAGDVKGYAEIRAELIREADLWLLKRQNDHLEGVLP